MSRDTVTDLLDVLALLLFAAGVAAATSRWLGWAALAPAGLVVGVGSQLIHRLGQPTRPGGES